MDAVIFCFAFIGFGGRKRTLAAQPAIGRPARAEGIERLLSLTHILK